MLDDPQDTDNDATFSLNSLLSSMKRDPYSTAIAGQ